MNLSSSNPHRSVFRALLLALVLGCAADDAASETGASSSDGSSTAADTSTGDPPRASVLEQCDAPSPCDSISRDPGSSEDVVHPALECALEQAIDSIANGAALELRWSFCDIGCWGTDLILLGDGTAYLQGSSTTDVTIFEQVERCTPNAALDLEACQGQPWSTNDCKSALDWVTDCAPVDDAQCP